MTRNTDDYVGIKYYFLIRARNAFAYFDRCVNSVISQKNINFKIIYIDDHSTLTNAQKKHMKNKLKQHVLIFNKFRKYSIRNAYEAIHTYIPDDATVVSLDGDDWLIRDDALSIINRVYKNTNCKLTYGNCIYFSPHDPIHQKISTNIHPYANTKYKENSGLAYRKDYFRPLHLKTWNAGLFKQIHKKNFLFPNGKWLRFCEDQAIMYPLLELCNGSYTVISTPFSVYNISHDNSDVARNNIEKILDEVSIRRGGKSLKLQAKYKKSRFETDSYMRIRHSHIRRGIHGALEIVTQLTSLFFRRAKTIYVDDHLRRIQRVLLLIAGMYTRRFVVKSMNIGIALSGSKIPMVLDAVIDKKLTDKYVENIMWSLTFCDTITSRCLVSLEKNNIHLKKLSLVHE